MTFREPLCAACFLPRRLCSMILARSYSATRGHTGGPAPPVVPWLHEKTDRVLKQAGLEPGDQKPAEERPARNNPIAGHGRNGARAMPR